VAKQRRAGDRVYPRDLYAVLQERWDNKPFFKGWPAVPLPPKPVLDELLDVCYHASMMTEEGRPTVFRIAYLASSSPVSSRDGDELPPVTRYAFSKPVSFTQGELRRLAPVADPRRVLIAVEQADDKLQIYGLIDIGLALWEMGRHERGSGFASPEALIIMSTRPGELSISRGDRPVLRLRDGQLVTPTKSVLRWGPVAEFFVPAAAAFIGNACQLSGIVQDPAKDDGLADAHLSFIESVLLYTAELKHGGTLLFVPEEITHEDSRLLSRASIKYVLPSSRPRDALVSAMAVRLRRNDRMDQLQVRNNVRVEEMEEYWTLEGLQMECEDAARDAARFIASLTAVDGAVVLTDSLRIIGFGAEVTATFAADKVYVAQDAEGVETVEARFVEFGTRHRSAFRFAGSMENCVAFVMSQDGGIKAVKQVGSRLLMWTYFQIGFATALA
jgi:Probable sensor domain DACNV